jgi:transposase
MKRETRGRKTRLDSTLTKKICALLAKGLDQKSACCIAGVPYSTYNEWKQKGSEGIEPFSSFFSVISRARDRHKLRLLKIVFDAAEGLLPRHADWKAASWLLEKGWPLEYGDRRPLPIPREEQTSVGIRMYGTLPSGNLAPLDEMMEVARQWHEAAQPKKQPAETEPTETESEMKHWYNPISRKIELREPTDNCEHED